ncbi:hypothetical protein [Kitasatospora phosalacinea]|uniref:hypothetical protein n=1 Tax=Kitasatospora phosalacinea TaxID=2065 RepID=UPI00331B078B
MPEDRFLVLGGQGVAGADGRAVLDRRLLVDDLDVSGSDADAVQGDEDRAVAGGPIGTAAIAGSSVPVSAWIASRVPTS